MPSSVAEPVAPDNARADAAFLEWLLGASRILVMPHERSDADALGTAAAFARLIRENTGIPLQIISKDTPEHLDLFRYLPGVEGVELVPDDTAEAAIVAKLTAAWRVVLLDCAGPALPGLDAIVNEAIRLEVAARLDHHLNGKDVSLNDRVTHDAGATAVLVYHLAKIQDWKIGPEVATGLLAGLMLDTGFFEFESVRAEHFRIAADLLRKGANINAIADGAVAYRSLKHLHVEGSIYESWKFVDDALDPTLRFRGDGRAGKHDDRERIPFISVIAGDGAAAAATEFPRGLAPVVLPPGALLRDAFPVVDSLSLTGAPMALAFRYTVTAKGVELSVSARSEGRYDAAAFLDPWKGGGHPNAGGKTLFFPATAWKDPLKKAIEVQQEIMAASLTITVDAKAAAARAGPDTVTDPRARAVLNTACQKFEAIHRRTNGFMSGADLPGAYDEAANLMENGVLPHELARTRKAMDLSTLKELGRTMQRVAIFSNSPVAKTVLPEGGRRVAQEVARRMSWLPGVVGSFVAYTDHGQTKLVAASRTGMLREKLPGGTWRLSKHAGAYPLTRPRHVSDFFRRQEARIRERSTNAQTVNREVKAAMATVRERHSLIVE